MKVMPKVQKLENSKEIAMADPFEIETEMKLESLSDLSSEVLMGSWLA